MECSSLPRLEGYLRPFFGNILATHHTVTVPAISDGLPRVFTYSIKISRPRFRNFPFPEARFVTIKCAL